MNEAPFQSLDQQLVREIADKCRLIRELEEERRILERMLIKARQSDVGSREVARSSSVRRLLAEDAIVSQLKRNVPPQTTISQLWVAVQRVGVESEATFRSHLHRLKNRGIVENRGRGVWRWVDNEA